MSSWQEADDRLGCPRAENTWTDMVLVRNIALPLVVAMVTVTQLSKNWIHVLQQRAN